jgi:hypothetical protein
MSPGVAGILQTEYSRAMPLQNRVTPFSRIEAVPQRGLFTGNRGVLHDDQRRLLTERWRHRHWIICDLHYKDWRRTLMTPSRWTELFFLDEAVALAAGHRPCAFCRREAFRRFAAAWGSATGSTPKAPEIDRQLHDERIPLMRGSPRHSRPLSALPAGSMVLLAENPAQPYLVSAGKLLPRLLPRLLPWTHAGYGAPISTGDREVLLLTPPPTVAALAHGYRPVLHPSAA